MILSLLFSIFVALFWLKKFRKMDKYDKEPERLVYLAFFAGIVATLPSILLEIPLQMGGLRKSPPLPYLFAVFLWVGLVEEFFKYLAVRLTVYRSGQFNEVMDGMIYMISAALGFAATENVGYMMGFGFSAGIVRAVLSYLGHVSFSAILGYYLGKGKAEGRRGWVWLGFGLAVCLHWLYNTFFVAGTINASAGLVLLGLMIWGAGLVFMFILIRKAQVVSPFRAAHILPRRLTRQCQACGKTVSSKAWICHHCGEPLSLEEETLTLKA